MNSLVGYTGFVGSNLKENGVFDRYYNSKNISEAYETNPDLLVYAGLRAEKYLANSDPEKDYEQIKIAEDNIRRINPRKLVLISTIDVFKTPFNVDEKSVIDVSGLHPYGYNRYLLECWVKENHPDSLIIRLPGLFGKNIKKNFIYDYVNLIPSMLKEEKYLELSGKDPRIKAYYTKLGNGFYKVTVPDSDKDLVKQVFKDLNFTALNFTDSRSVFQFFNLRYLWKCMEIALSSDIRLLHLATEPVSAGELYNYLTGDYFRNELGGTPANYNYKTIYDNLYGGKNGYILDKYHVMSQIKDFVEGY